MIDKVTNCGRCGEDHGEIKFSPLSNASDAFKFFALCPKTSEPILLAKSDDFKASVVELEDESVLVTLPIVIKCFERWYRDRPDYDPEHFGRYFFGMLVEAIENSDTL